MEPESDRVGPEGETPGRPSPRAGGGRRVRVGVVFGGQSAEHDVSLMSAASVIQAMDPDRFDVVPLAIGRDGAWLPPPVAAAMLPGATDLAPSAAALVATDVTPASLGRAVDVVFPVLHGPMGEDGTIQGLLELAGIPYVGSGVLGSALGMEKARMKEALRYHGLPITEWRTFHRREWRGDPSGVAARAGAFGFPCFVKPSALGSSVGVSKVKDPMEMPGALASAFRHGERVLVEPAVDAREIEVSVLGNHVPVASVAGEIVPSNEFYDYAAKYLDGRSTLHLPADLAPSQSDEVRALAVRAFVALDCSGLARADFFLDRRSGAWYVNELNTMPGFTKISMYPKLWEASGLPYPDLLGRLVDLAFERWEDRRPEA